MLLVVAVAVSAPAQATGDWGRIAEPGPWPAVTRLIAFDGRIWFANSNPYENFNAADVYSFDPASGQARYERGLTSQDLGKPGVFQGRLFWPFEDPRSNFAQGEFAVTDGREWRWNIFTEGVALHVHTMTLCGGAFYAGTGGWNGALQRSSNGLDGWAEVYRHPTPNEGQSQITDLAGYQGRCFFAVTSSDIPGAKLYDWNGSEAKVVPGWPTGSSVDSLTVFENALYAINISSIERTLWRYDGTQAARIELPTEEVLRALAATPDRLLAVTSSPTGGTLWETRDGETWVSLRRIEGERPVAVLGNGEDVYVGTFSTAGKGALWGPTVPTVQDPGPSAVALPPIAVRPVEPQTLTPALSALDLAFQPRADYMAFRRAITSITIPLALTKDPNIGEQFSQRLVSKLPSGRLENFTGQTYNHAEVARWLLLNSIALNGNGRVPVEWLAHPWIAPPRPTEKYFDSGLAAIWAVGLIGQKDQPTIDALIARLGIEGQPGWLIGDIVSALTALTGNRFGIDPQAWIEWWGKARESWPENGG